jgi:hypothetical protein
MALCGCVFVFDWEVAANVATALGFAAGAVGAVMALRTYRHQVRSADEAHAHGLFRELMGMKARGDARDEDAWEALQLYTLEEVFDWLEDRRKRGETSDELTQWTATVASHLTAHMATRVRDNALCYGEHFISFVQVHAPRRQPTVV